MLSPDALKVWDYLVEQFRLANGRDPQRGDLMMVDDDGSEIRFGCSPDEARAAGGSER